MVNVDLSVFGARRNVWTDRQTHTVPIVHIPAGRAKGALTWYGKLTWEAAHAWNLVILCLLSVWGMTFIFIVHLNLYAIPLQIPDVTNDITRIA